MTSTDLQIRPVLPEDALAIYEIMRDPRVNTNLVELPSMEIAVIQKELAESQAGLHRLVAVNEAGVVGSGTLTHFQRPRLLHSGRLALAVHGDHWSQGVGSALTAALLDVADNWLDLKRCELDVLLDNAGGIRLYEKFGFTVEGIRQMAVFGGDGRFHDEYQMARLRLVETMVNSPTAAAPPARPPQQPLPTPVTIRPMRPDDTTAWYELRRQRAAARTTMQLPSLERTHSERQVENPPPGIHRLVAESGGKMVGLLSVHMHTRPRLAHSGGLGMMVHEAYWGQGIGTQLMEAAVDLADNWLNLRRLDLEVNTDNPAAIHLYKKFGFVVEGTKRFHTYGDGRWADTHFMARLRP